MIHHLDRNFEENSDLKWEIGQFLFEPKNPQKGIWCGKFNLAKMGHSIHHLDCNFEENPDLKSVFEYLLCGICYGSISAGGGVMSTLPKWDILYIICTAIWRRIQI